MLSLLSQRGEHITRYALLGVYDYALENHFYFIDKVKVKNGIPVYNYYVSEKCRKLLFEILSQHGDIDFFRKAS